MVDDLRALLRLAKGRSADPSAILLDSRTMQATPESGSRAGYDGHKKRNGTKTHMAMDTLGHLLSLHVTPAHEQERAQVAALAEEVQEHGSRLEVVKHTEAERGLVLLPRRWVVGRSFGWAARFRRLARDYERLPETLEGLHFVAFAILMLARAAPLIVGSEQALGSPEREFHKDEVTRELPTEVAGGDPWHHLVLSMGALG